MLHKGSSMAGAFSYALYFACKRTFSKWAMLESNQRPPPCKGDVASCTGVQGLANSLYLSRFSSTPCPSLWDVATPVVSKGVRTSCSAGAPAWPCPSCCPRSCRFTTVSKPCRKIPCRCECGTCRTRPRHGDTQVLIAHPLPGRQRGVLLSYSQPRRLKTR